MQTQKTLSHHQRYTHSLSSSATTTTTMTDIVVVAAVGVVVVVVVPHIPLDADTEEIVTPPEIHAQFE